MFVKYCTNHDEKLASREKKKKKKKKNSSPDTAIVSRYYKMNKQNNLMHLGVVVDRNSRLLKMMMLLNRKYENKLRDRWNQSILMPKLEKSAN